MTHVLRGIAVTVALAFASGCSTHRMAEQTRLPLHPIHETRMTNQPAPGYVATGVWRVRGVQNIVYLAGTCHVVGDDEIPFPSSYYAAYRDSGEVLVEGDSLSWRGAWLMMSGLPGAMRFFLEHRSEFTCPKGKTLEDYLSLEMTRKLREHYGEAYEKSRHFTPLGLVFFAEFEGISEGNAGADDLFSLLAHRDGKRIRSLDSRKAPQLAGPVLEAMLSQVRSEIASRGAEAVVEETLLQEQEARVDWRYGDTSAEEKEVAELKRTHPELYQQLLPERNREWFPAITRALHGKRNVMVLVGALHLAGEEGLIEMLRRAGFKPEQLYGIDRPHIAKRTVAAE